MFAVLLFLVNYVSSSSTSFVLLLSMMSGCFSFNFSSSLPSYDYQPLYPASSSSTTTTITTPKKRRQTSSSASSLFGASSSPPPPPLVVVVSADLGGTPPLLSPSSLARTVDVDDENKADKEQKEEEEEENEESGMMMTRGEEEQITVTEDDNDDEGEGEGEGRTRNTDIQHVKSHDGDGEKAMIVGEKNTSGEAGSSHEGSHQGKGEGGDGHRAHNAHLLDAIDLTWSVGDTALQVAGFSATFAVIIAIYDIGQHAQHFTHPTIQRCTMRILFMIPVYAGLSYLSLVLPNIRFFLFTIRDTYESFVLYQFIALLVAYCGGEAQLCYSLNQKRYKGIHPFPCCCLPLFKLDREFFLRCKRWVLQYALIKPLIAVAAMVFHPFGLYLETNYDFSTNLFPYLFVINNFSISWALWYLVVFHNECEKELEYCKPMLKFISIKIIIFFVFWQGSSLGVLHSMGFIYVGHEEEEMERVMGAFQDVLMCLELAPIAILHHFAFAVKKLKDEMKDQPVFAANTAAHGGNESTVGHLNEALDIGDMVEDTIRTVFAKKGALVAAEQGNDSDDYYDDGGATGRRDGNKNVGEVMSVVEAVDQLGEWARTPSPALTEEEGEEGAECGGEDDGDEYDGNGNGGSKYYSRPDTVIRVANGNADGFQHFTKSLYEIDEPLPHCVVCGRTDLPLKERRSGLKCNLCIGTRHQLMSHV